MIQQSAKHSTGGAPQAVESARQERVLASLRAELDDADATIERGTALGADAAMAIAFGLRSRIPA
jgi:hypothetical protein